MRGQILHSDKAGGVIATPEGARYRFAAAEWRGRGGPFAGLTVDFVAEGEIARDIYALPQAFAPRGPDNSVLFGTLGVLCLVLSFVIPFLPLVGAFIVGLVGAESAKRHRNANGLLLSRISWVGALLLVVAGIGFVVWAGFLAWPMLEQMFDILRELMREPEIVA
jgi:hypothetical protein